MTFTNTDTIMQNEYNPVLQLKAQKINGNEMVKDSGETKRGFNTPDSLSPVKVMGLRESVELTVVGKLKSCLVKQAKKSEKVISEEFPVEEKVKAWSMPNIKAKITYNPQEYPVLSNKNSVTVVKLSKPVILKMSAKNKENFKEEMAKNLTSSMSSRPTLYKRAPTAREKGFAVLKNNNGRGFEKTVMCKWGGRCRNKNKCSYAHSEEELTPRMCVFGAECHKKGCQFPHNEKEAIEWKKIHIAKWQLSQKLSKLPRKGYVCRSCGKEGGCADSHWVRDCPHKQKRSPPGAGYVCKCCGQKGGEKGAHWVQQCPKSTRSPQKSKRSPSKSPQKPRRAPKKLKVKRSPNKEGWVKV